MEQEEINNWHVLQVQRTAGIPVTGGSWLGATLNPRRKHAPSPLPALPCSSRAGRCQGAGVQAAVCCWNSHSSSSAKRKQQEWLVMGQQGSLRNSCIVKSHVYLPGFHFSSLKGCATYCTQYMTYINLISFCRWHYWSCWSSLPNDTWQAKGRKKK